MTVAELIEALQEMPADAVIAVEAGRQLDLAGPELGRAAFFTGLQNGTGGSLVSSKIVREGEAIPTNYNSAAAQLRPVVIIRMGGS